MFFLSSSVLFFISFTLLCCIPVAVVVVILQGLLPSLLSSGHILPSLVLFFFFQLLPSRVATADFPSPFGPNFCTLLRHFNHCHTVTACIHLLLAFPVSSFLAAPSSASFSQYTHNLSSVSPNHLSCASRVYSKMYHLRCPSDVLIRDIVRCCHS